MTKALLTKPYVGGEEKGSCLSQPSLRVSEYSDPPPQKRKLKDGSD